MNLLRHLASLALLVALPLAIAQVPIPGQVVGGAQAVVQGVAGAARQIVTGGPTLNLQAGQIAAVGQTLNINQYQGYPVYWGSYGGWSRCQGVCGAGIRRRQRRCYATVTFVNGQFQSVATGGSYTAINAGGPFTLGPQNTAALSSLSTYGPLPSAPVLGYQSGAQYTTGCFGTLVQAQGCRLPNPCVTIRWSVWRKWSLCNAACGGGRQQRIRTCSVAGRCQGESVEYRPCNTASCVGNWGIWVISGSCTAQCGGGTQARTRPCLNGGNCVGLASDTVPCNIQPCPGIWGRWTIYGACTAQCGGGTQTRTRLCTGGSNCIGLASEIQSCNTQPCVRYGWSIWRPWTVCSATCGPGTRKRDRDCLYGEARQDGYEACMRLGGMSTETQPCGAGPCYGWARWEPWTGCPPCGVGQNTRHRRCLAGVQPYPNDRPCLDQGGLGLESQPCLNLPSCSKWDDWGPWLGCRPSCGAGKDRRTRRCLTNGRPDISDVECRKLGGVFFEDRDCNNGPCYGWGPWTPWTLCPVTCGPGQVTRSRKCQADGYDTEDYTKCPPTSAGLLGPSVGYQQRRECFENPCYNWGVWDQWSGCPVCGAGENRRTRRCYAGNRPHLNSLPCERQGGRYMETQPCLNLPPCYTWRRWGEWSQCQPSCGVGYRSRERICTGVSGNSVAPSLCPVDGQSARQREACQGLPPCYRYMQWTQWSNICTVTCGGGVYVRTRVCMAGDRDTDISNCAFDGRAYEERPCPVISCVGVYSAWTAWGPCSETCGDGQQSQQRTCSNNNCVGPSINFQNCNLRPCVTYYLAAWSEYSICIGTCGSGIQTRSRTCVSSAGGGVESNYCSVAPGDLSDSKACKLPPCVTYRLTLWDDWSVCSAACGTGYQKRNRRCVSSTGEIVLPVSCSVLPEALSESKSCNGPPCVTYEVSEWGLWSDCSATCGQGVSFRRKRCVSNFGEDALFSMCGYEESQMVDRKTCINQPCISYSITAFGAWQGCSATCGPGFEIRTKSCQDNFGKIVNNELCGVDASSMIGRRPCNERPCFGVWTEYAAWFPCSRTCGPGEQYRRRVCSTNRCIGDAEERRVCNLGQCVFYFASSWSTWTRCSVTCGVGYSIQKRKCESSVGGAAVDSNFCNLKESELTNTRTCEQQDCYAYAQWTSWSPCNANCGQEGTMRRTRGCMTTSGANVANNFCASLSKGKGIFDEVITCLVTSCPGVFLEWESWTRCSAPCNSGTRNRVRRCPADRCIGTSKEIDVCNSFPCELEPDEGVWGPWTLWSVCTNPCGGVSSQSRSCARGRCQGEYERRKVCSDCPDRICTVSPGARRDCGFDGITPAQCIQRGCCWDNSIRNTVWCFNGGDYSGGSVVSGGGRVVVGGGGGSVVVGGGGGGGGFETSSSGSILIVTDGGKTTTTTTETDNEGQTVVTTTTDLDELMVDGQGFSLKGFDEPCPACWDRIGPVPVVRRFYLCGEVGGCGGRAFREEKVRDCVAEELPECVSERLDRSGDA